MEINWLIDWSAFVSSHTNIHNVITPRSKMTILCQETGANPACRADRLPKFENFTMVWNYRELLVQIIGVRWSDYKINPPLLITVSGYKYWHTQKKHSLATFSTYLKLYISWFTSPVMYICWLVMHVCQLLVPIHIAGNWYNTFIKYMHIARFRIFFTFLNKKKLHKNIPGKFWPSSGRRSNALVENAWQRSVTICWNTFVSSITFVLYSYTSEAQVLANAASEKSE